MKIVRCIKFLEKFTEGSFYDMMPASHDPNVMLLVTEIKNYSVENLKNGLICREEKGIAMGKNLFNQHFEIIG